MQPDTITTARTFAVRVLAVEPSTRWQGFMVRYRTFADMPPRTALLRINDQPDGAYLIRRNARLLLTLRNSVIVGVKEVV